VSLPRRVIEAGSITKLYNGSRDPGNHASRREPLQKRGHLDEIAMKPPTPKSKVDTSSFSSSSSLMDVFLFLSVKQGNEGIEREKEGNV
jgi:hypothetical protein